LTYDYESRLTSVSGPGITASYTYNGLNTRVGKTENGNTQVYKRDGVGVTDAVLSDSSAFYTPGVSEKRAGTTSYLHGGLKNQTRQTNSSQTTTATRTYDAFGNVTSSSGTWNGPFGNAGSFGYQEDATGLKLLGHRYYDSSLGRFITRDPIKDGRNWYAYCGNDPVNGVDPSGLSICSVLDDAWVNFSEWWSGTDAVGPNGEKVRIGGWHAFFFNVGGNAMTVNDTVHLNDPEDYDKYLNDPDGSWSRHEVRHIQQAEEWFGGSAISFVTYSLIGYCWGLGHDGAPQEIDAENYAHGLNNDIFGRGLWPFFHGDCDGASNLKDQKINGWSNPTGF
jgi:RHS repeat-associated protein